MKKKIALSVVLSLGMIITGCSNAKDAQKQEQPQISVGDVKNSDQSSNTSGQSSSSEQSTNSSEQSSNSEQKLSISQIFDKMKEAKNNLKSINSNLFVNFTVENSGKIEKENQNMQGDIVYGNSKAIEKIKMNITTDSNGKSTMEDVVTIKGKELVEYRKKSDSSWVSKSYGENGVYNIYPNYMNLIDIIVSLPTANLNMVDTGSTYEITTDAKDISLLDTFGKEYRLNVGNLSDSQLDKKIKIVIDKQTYNLKNLNIWLSFRGKNGGIESTFNVDYSNWNGVDANSIVAPK